MTGTVATLAVERDGMRFHTEAWGRKVAEVTGAGIDVKHPITAPALKVVVVAMGRQFVAGVLARQVHRTQQPVIQATDVLACL